MKASSTLIRKHLKSLILLLAKANVHSLYKFLSQYTVNTILQINIQFTTQLQNQLNVETYEMEGKGINPFWQYMKYQRKKHSYVISDAH